MEWTMKKIFASLMVLGGVLIFCMSGGNPPESLAAGPRLVLEKITVPELVAPEQVFTVQLTVGDARGVAKVDVRFDNQAYRVKAGGGIREVVSVRIKSGKQTGMKKLEAVATGIDSKKGRGLFTFVRVDKIQPAVLPIQMSVEAMNKRRLHWKRLGLTPLERYARNEDYSQSSIPLRELDEWDDSITTRKKESGVSVSETKPMGVKWWGDGLYPAYRQPFDWKSKCSSSVTGYTPNGEILRCWLDLHPDIKSKLTWDMVVMNDTTSFVGRFSYASWTADMKSSLDKAFYAYWSWLDGKMAATLAEYPDPAINQAPADYKTQTVLNYQQAWVMYVDSVAFSLALEIGGFVPWSVLGYQPDDWRILFSSDAIVPYDTWDYTKSNGQTGTVKGYFLPRVTHAPPAKVFKFFVEKDLLRTRHLGTIARLLKWGRENMIHAGCLSSYTNLTAEEKEFYHWQYYGDPPVSRMMNKTANACLNNQVASWTDGCIGTSAFFSSILRAVNIPAYALYGNENTEAHLCMHTVPVFPTIGKTLSHGDDVYGIKKNYPTLDPSEIPSQEVLIAWDTFTDWFINVQPYAGCDNIGRQVDEVAIKFLPNWVMDLYCGAKNNVIYEIKPCKHPVIKSFERIHTCQELRMDLTILDRAKAKDEKLNYCNTP